MTQPAIVATLANLGARFTEQSTDVWCSVFDQPAETNFDGATHFCQYCGATDHSPDDDGVQVDPFATGGLLSELSVSHRADQD